MAKILYDKELKKFKTEFKLKGNKVIIFLDEKYKIASYIVDAGDKIITDYEKILKYYKS